MHHRDSECRSNNGRNASAEGVTSDGYGPAPVAPTRRRISCVIADFRIFVAQKIVHVSYNRRIQIKLQLEHSSTVMLPVATRISKSVSAISSTHLSLVQGYQRLKRVY